MSDAVELLDRQFNRLRDQDGAEFVQELKVFYEFVTTSGPAEVTSALLELREDAARIEREFNAHDAEMVPELVDLKARLVATVPETDDSQAPRPTTDWPREPFEWLYTLANFDQLTTGGPDRFMLKQGGDESTSGMLLRILENRVHLLQFSTDPGNPTAPMSDANLRPELDQLRRDLRNLGDRHRHAVNIFTNAIETHGGVQIQLLDWVVEEMNPAPVHVESEEDEHARVNQMFKRLMSGMYALEDAAAGRELSGYAADALTFSVERIKPAVDKVYEGIRLKVALAPAPVPRADYGVRLRRWVLSPGYALVGGPCISGVITQVVQDKGKGAVLFLLLAIAAAVGPPLREGLPRLTYTRVSLGFVVIASAAVVVALVTASLGVAFLVFLLAVVAFVAGDYTGARRIDSA